MTASAFKNAVARAVTFLQIKVMSLSSVQCQKSFSTRPALVIPPTNTPETPSLLSVIIVAPNRAGGRSSPCTVTVCHPVSPVQMSHSSRTWPSLVLPPNRRTVCAGRGSVGSTKGTALCRYRPEGRSCTLLHLASSLSHASALALSGDVRPPVSTQFAVLPSRVTAWHIRPCRNGGP